MMDIAVDHFINRGRRSVSARWFIVCQNVARARRGTTLDGVGAARGSTGRLSVRWAVRRRKPAPLSPLELSHHVSSVGALGGLRSRWSPWDCCARLFLSTMTRMITCAPQQYAVDIQIGDWSGLPAQLPTRTPASRQTRLWPGVASFAPGR